MFLPNLSFDIQGEIIKKLPVKSLIQFRSVCKAWKSLIDSSRFIAGYTTQSQHLVAISYEVGHHEVRYVSIVDDDDDTFPQQKFSLTVPPLAQITMTFGSSHGLLCLIGKTNPTFKIEIALWNPAIRKSIVVALPNSVTRPFHSVVGFGVCPDTKDPKLVKITYIDDHREIESISCIPCQVMVFTLSSGEWTCLSSNQLPRKSIQFTWSQVVIGQFIYWFAFNWINVDGTRRLGRPRNMIMSFDMCSQEFREIDLPDNLAELCHSKLSISRLRESLAVVEYGDVVELGTYLTQKQVFNVWMMEHGDSKVFTKLFTINAPNASTLRTLGFRKSGELIVELWQGDGKDCYTTVCALVADEPCSQHIIKDLGIHGKRYSSIAISYMESLLLLDYDDGHIVRCGAAMKW